MLDAINDLGLSFYMKARTAPSVCFGASEASPGLFAKDQGLILLFHLAQFVIPRRFLLHTLHAELSTQWRCRVGCPDNLTDSFIAAAFYHYKLTDGQVA